MSWLYSRALVEAYSQGTSLDGGPCAPSSGTPTPQAYSSHGKMTDFSRLSRFGMTFKPLTDDLGGAVLTWCLAVSPAKTSAQPEKARASTENEAECGHTWRGSLARFDRDSFSWKTPQCSLLAGLDEFSETWPRWGTMHNGECSEQSMPAHLTSAKESGLWPTPVADGDRTTNYAQGVTSLGFAARNWPTPTVCGNYNRKGASKSSGDGLASAVKMVATPTARDWRSGKASQATHDKNSRPLSEQIGGSLNPTWVEWLMGWPLGWTDLKPLETDKFRQWQHLHGKRYV